MTSTACYSCAFFNDLYAVRASFVSDIFNLVGPEVTNVATLALTIWVLMQGMMGIMQPSSVSARAMNIVKTGILCIVVMGALRPTGGAPLVNQWILDPLEDMGLRYGQTILTAKLGEVSNAAATNAYSQFSYVVEQQIFRVLDVPAMLMDSSGSNPLVIALTIIVSLLIFLPFAFIFGLVAAFMLEAMFKFVAIGIVAPLLTGFSLFQPTRPFTVAGIRILIGAFFTLVFTGGALGFTMRTVDVYATALKQGVCQRYTDEEKLKEAGCTNSYPASDGWVFVDRAVGSGYWLNTKSGAVVETSSGFATLFDKNIIMMFIIGFASILLHLQAKALASNISGANDGAGPAAATLAAMKGLAAGGAYYGMQAAFGQGGAGTTAQQLLRGEGMQNITAGGLRGFGQAIHQHGVIGGAATGLATSFRFGADRSGGGGGGGSGSGAMPSWSQPSDWKAAAPAQRFSTGQPGSGGQHGPGGQAGGGPGQGPGGRPPGQGLDFGRRNRNG